MVGVWTLATNVGNNGQTSVDLPASLGCDPNQLYLIALGAAVNNLGYNQYSSNFKLSCEGGSITVVKTVINDSGSPIPNGSFPVDVACGPGGPNTTLVLSGANNFQDSVMYIPLGRKCTINEPAPKAPPGCRWLTTYPQGKDVLIGNAGYRRAVINRLSCKDTVSAGTLTVIKQVINDSATAPPPNTPFHVQVTCLPNGPNIAIALSAANGFAQVVGNIPANGACTLVEQPPVVAPDLVTRGCGWTTSYPEGSEAAVVKPDAVSDRGAAQRRTVVNRWNCKEDEESGKVTVIKKVVNNTSTPIHAAQFHVQLDCTPGGPHQLVTLMSPGNLQQTISVPLGSNCTITELPPVAPRPCRWRTTYPNGQSGKIGAVLEVINELVCEDKPTGSLTVHKVVTDLLPSEPAPNPIGGFQVAVSCSNGYTQTLHLNRGGAQTVSGLPLGASCTVVEAVPSPPIFGAPLSCPTPIPGSGGSGGGLGPSTGPIYLATWNTPTYAPGQTIAIAAGANVVKITNSFRCPVQADGNREQPYRRK